MEHKITISFNWWKDDSSTVKPEHKEALYESAMTHISAMMNEGFTAGDLSDNIRMIDEDGEDGIHYRGWWSMAGEAC